jgi:hypothetical protein
MTRPSTSSSTYAVSLPSHHPQHAVETSLFLTGARVSEFVQVRVEDLRPRLVGDQSQGRFNVERPTDLAAVQRVKEDPPIAAQHQHAHRGRQAARRQCDRGARVRVEGIPGLGQGPLDAGLRSWTCATFCTPRSMSAFWAPPRAKMASAPIAAARTTSPTTSAATTSAPAGSAGSTSFAPSPESVEAVAEAAYGHHVVGFGRVVFDFLAQASNVDHNCVVVGLVVLLPDLAEDLLAGEDATFVCRQKPQHLVAPPTVD